MILLKDSCTGFEFIVRIAIEMDYDVLDISDKLLDVEVHCFDLIRNVWYYF